MSMQSTEPQEISADSVISKLKESGIALLDNSSVSSALNNAPLCAFRPVCGDLENGRNMLLETLRSQLPETMPEPRQTTVAASPQYQNNSPGPS